MLENRIGCLLQTLWLISIGVCGGVLDSVLFTAGAYHSTSASIYLFNLLIDFVTDY